LPPVRLVNGRRFEAGHPLYQQPPPNRRRRHPCLPCTRPDQCRRSQPGDSRCRRSGANLTTARVARRLVSTGQVSPRSQSVCATTARMAIPLTRRSSVRLPDPTAYDDRPAPISTRLDRHLLRCGLLPVAAHAAQPALPVPRSAQLVSVDAVMPWPVPRMGRPRLGSGGRIPLLRILRRPHRQRV